MTHQVRACRVCGCTDDNCSGCVERTGVACWWIEDDLCSACDIFDPAGELDVAKYTAALDAKRKALEA